MNKTPLLAIMFLLFFLPLPLSVCAQDFSFPLPLAEKQRAVAGIMLAPTMRIVFENNDGFNSAFTLVGFTINPMFPGFKNEFGITNEQTNRLQEALRAMPRTENVNAVFGALDQKLNENIDYLPSEDEEAEIEGAFREVFVHFDLVAANTFSAEQIQKMDGMMFGLMGGLASPLLGDKHLVELELTDEQKEQFKTINKETSPERERILAELTTEMQTMFKRGRINFKDLEAMGLKFKDFAEYLQQRRMEVLTEAQLAKVEELSQPPKFLTASPLGGMIPQMMPQWVPGIHSWKPGDPIPEGGQQPQQERTRRFPREEN